MSRSGGSRRHPPIAALTLIETMVSLVVLTIVSLGVGVGMQSNVRSPGLADRALATSAELTSEMEAWRAVAFSNSPWPTSLNYSLTDTVTLKVGGQAISLPRTTAITLWDPNNFTSNATPQSDFVRVQIVINGQILTAFFAKPV